VFGTGKIPSGAPRRNVVCWNQRLTCRIDHAPLCVFSGGYTRKSETTLGGSVAIAFMGSVRQIFKVTVPALFVCL